jgi:hypothetical protein
VVLGYWSIDPNMGRDILDCGMDMNQPTSFDNQSPTKVQCAECHWVGISSQLVGIAEDNTLRCPICFAPFARYPLRAEHLWSDPY